MIDPTQSLSELLTTLEEAEITSICAKLRGIVAFTDQYTMELAASPKDEFLIHVAEVRRDAIELLDECDKVSGHGGDGLTRIKERFSALKSFVEFLFALRGGEMVEQAHRAL